MSARGVPVFNAPGANANAVKELVIAGMLMAARNLPAALRFVSALDPAAPDMEHTVESGKKAFAGFELAGHTLGVIGLGRIGCLVATRRSGSACTSSATIPRLPSTPPGACLRRSRRRIRWARS